MLYIVRNWFSIAFCVTAAFFVQRGYATIDVTLQMQLGNPSGAIVDTNNHDHYLIQRTVEAIDYSDNLGEPVCRAGNNITAWAALRSIHETSTTSRLPVNGISEYIMSLSSLDLL